MRKLIWTSVCVVVGVGLCAVGCDKRINEVKARPVDGDGRQLLVAAAR